MSTTTAPTQDPSTRRVVNVLLVAFLCAVAWFCWSTFTGGGDSASDRAGKACQVAVFDETGDAFTVDRVSEQGPGHLVTGYTPAGDVHQCTVDADGLATFVR